MTHPTQERTERMNEIAIDFRAVASWSMDGATDVALCSPDHGPRHWRDVARIGFLLNDSSWKTFIFAAFHDAWRENESEDPDHGKRAVQKLMECPVLEQLYGPDLVELCYALIYHDQGRTHENPTIATCWDADRLTIGRVGIIPDVAFFSTPEVVADLFEWVGIAQTIMASADASWEEIADAYDG